MSKHTPGPWYICRKRSREHWVDIAPHTNQPVAQVLDIHGTDQEVFNARLIAAAPDLLEALRHALEDGDDWRGLAESAIRKAEGGEA